MDGDGAAGREKFTKTMRKHSASAGIELVTSWERKMTSHPLFQLHHKGIYLLLLSVHQVEFLKKSFCPRHGTRAGKPHAHPGLG
jgi:hypothetical protein